MSKAEYYLSVVRSEPFIRSFFVRHSRDPEETSDLTQEAIAALLDGYRRFRGDSRFSTWAYSVCRNVYRKHVYYQARIRRIDETMKRDYAAACAEKVAATERLRISAVVEALEVADRRLYRLFYVERRSVAEIASLLGRTEGTAKWLLYRLRGRVRDAILNA